MYKILQRTAALLLLFNLVDVAVAAPVPASLGRNPTLNSTHYATANAPSFGANNITPFVDVPANLALSSEHFGLTGPLSMGLNYSDLTGTYVTAQYIKKMSDILALGLLGEYGNGQYRYNGTLGFQLTPQSLFKVSAERLNQRLPFVFDSGAIDKRISQDVIGARFQRVFTQTRMIKAFDFGGYYAAAHSVGLSPVFYTSNGMNCLGNPSGLACINERNIAGGISSGADLGFTALLTPKTLVQARLNYDQLRYSTLFTSRSHYNRQGFGTTINFEQLISPRLKLTGGLEYRAIYSSFNAALSWLAPFIVSAQTEISLFAQRIVSKNLTPDNNIVGLKFAFIGDMERYRDKDYQINSSAFLSDLSNWVREPAVKMNQVLAIAEQLVRLVAPTVHGINPSSGPLSGGNVVTIAGLNFNGDPPTVLIDGQIALVQFISPTQLSVTIPAASPQVVARADLTHQPTAVNVMLSNEDGQKTTISGGYIYTADAVGPPRLTSVTPSRGSIFGHTLIRILGLNLAEVTQITIGGVNAEIISDTATELEIVTPEHAAGTVSIVVTTAMGTYTFTDAFTYMANTPEISSISPNVGTVNGNTTTTITGTNLSSITAVHFGSTPATSLVINSDTSITAITPAYSSGPLVVNVQASDGTTNTTLVNGFTYQLGSPTISSITPNQGSTSGGTTLTVHGSGFSAGTTLTIEGLPATNITVINPTTLLATTPAYVSGPLTAEVTVNNGEGSFSLAGGYTYTVGTPTLSSLTPNSGSIHGGSTVTLSGSGFVAGTTVSFGGISATDVHILDATRLTAVTPVHASGAVDVVVNNGSGSASLSSAFTYEANAPTLTSISPASSSVAGGIAVTLTGTNLTGMTSVSIGGIAASSVVVVNDTSITAVIPAYVSGPLVVDVLVGNGSVNATLVGGFSYLAVAPTITSISPNSSSVAGGITATVQGSGFIPGTTVTLGGLTAMDIHIVNASTLTLTVPAYVSGSLIKNVVVNNGVGGATLTGGFTYTVNAPTLSGISPATGSITGGSLVTLTGSGFTPTTTVSFGGLPAINVTVSSATSLTAVTPAYASGSLAVDVVVTNSVSNATLTGGFTYQAIAPTLTSINPNTGPVAGGITVTVQGSGFVPGTTLTVGGIAATNISITSVGSLTATLPAYVSGSLTKEVTVNNGMGSATLTGSFTYTESAPSLTSLTPSTGSIAGGTTVTLTGSGFTPNTTVSIGGQPATSVLVSNATTLTAITPAYSSGALTVDVVVNNGIANATLSNAFTYQPMAPTLATVAPDTGPTSGGTIITLTGSGFVQGTSVTVGGVPATSVTVVNTHSLTAVVPAYVSGPLAQDVTVNNGEGSATLANGFTYMAAIPTLTGIAPSSGTTAGGTTITLTGTGFVPGVTVLVDGVSASNVQVVNGTTLTAVTPVHVAAVVDVAVDNGVGTATLTNAFTYTAGAPSLSGINPSTGSVAGGTVITLSGTNLSAISTVTVGGILATDVTVVNSSTVTALVPAYVSGPLVADVRASDGSSNVTLVGGFTYQASAPSIVSISPNTSTVAGGITATVTGTGFVPGTLVMIGGVTANNITVVNASTITLSVPAYVSGSLIKDVSVNNSVGFATLAAGFIYTPVAPTLASITPTTGPTVGGTEITVTGTGFTRSSAVLIGGNLATGIMVINATTLTAITPAYISGSLAADVEVRNGVSNATLPGGFTYVPASPTIASISPAAGTVDGGTTLSITGTNFTQATTISIGGLAASSVNVLNSTTLIAITPAYVSGSLVKDVAVANEAGTTVLSDSYTYLPNAPTLISSLPVMGTASGGTVVTLIGTNFTPTTTVTFGGLPATNVVVNSETSLTAVTPAYVNGALSVDIVANNGVSNAILPAAFTYQVANPTLASISPNTGSINGGTAVIIMGSNFTPNTTVTIGGVAATAVSVVNANTLTAITPAYVSGALVVDVAIDNGVATAVLPTAFTYTAMAPTLLSVSPNSGATAGGTTITLVGSGFIPGTTVTVGGVAAINVQLLSATTLTAVTPVHASGEVDIRVTNSISSATLSNAFTYIAGAPTLTGITPAAGSVAGGLQVTLSGTNLTGISAVTVGGLSATNVTVVDDSTVTAMIPAYVSGALVVDVTASNGVANATLSAAFTYQVAIPTIGTVLPNTGSIAGGTVVTITGTDFAPGTTVTIGGVSATAVTVVNSTTLTLTTPPYAGGALNEDVVVTNSAGSATLTGGFIYTLITPTLTSISPAVGPVAGGTGVTLFGTGFTPTTVVTIGGSPATTVVVTNATQLTAITPAYVSGPLAANVTVDNGESNAVLNGGFTYQAAAPTIQSINPNSGSIAGSTSVTVSGTNFTPTTTLTIGGIAATSVHVINETTLTAVTPAYVSGALVSDVVVTNNVGSATLSGGYTYLAIVPALTNVNPNTGPIVGGTTITLTGTGFTPGTTVTIGGIAATSVTLENATTLTAVTPAYVSGPLAANVVVNNGVGSATIIGGFIYQAAAPTITTISPNTGTVLGGTSVTISGGDFTPNTTVTIGGIAVTSIDVVNASTLIVSTPAYLAGSLVKDVVVNNEAGSFTATGGFTYTGAAPTLTNITPSVGSIGGGTVVTLTGTSFTPATSVTFGGVAATNIVVSSATTLSAVTPAYFSGSLVVDVTINNGVASATLTSGFAYQAVAPTLSTVSPNSGPVTGNTSLTISGTNFTPTTTVTVGGIAATNITVVDATTITASTPAYVGGALTVDVAVNNGAGNAILAGGFTYTAVAPSLSTVLPANGSIAGGTTITLSGSGFVPGMSVSLGGTAASNVTVVNASTITAVTPLHASGAVDVVVSGSAGNATLTGGFTYVTLAPTLSTISPLVGSVAGGTNVTLTGTNLTGTTGVTFAGIAATNVVVVNDTSVTATVPAYVSGSLVVDVTVSNAMANATLSGAFTYQAATPTISSIVPNTGSIAGGTSVTVSGTGFVPGTTVSIGGISATGVSVVNANTLTLSTPAYVSGSLVKDVVITNSVSSVTAVGGFTYTAIAPTLTSINPSTGPVAGGTTVTLTGTGFIPTTTVKIGGIAPTSITVTSATSITAVTPAYVSGALAADVVVNNGVSNAILSGGFIYQPALPTLVSITPSSGSMAGGTAVTVSGTNFTPSTTLSIGGLVATSVNVVNATSLTAVIPAYVSGALAKNVVVSNSVGSATLTNGYTYLAIAPTVTNVLPGSGPTAGGTTITVTGTGFTPTTSVTVGGISATSVSVANATTLTAVTPAYVSGALTKDVTVNNGNSNATLAASFTYIASAPTLVNISPTSGPTSGGTSITLTGTAFIPGTTVSIGGVAATNVTVVNATTLTATTPAYVSGSLVETVVVNNGIATASLLNAFTYIASAPTISAITPNTGTSSGGTSVTISGTNFIPGSSATIGGQATTSTTVVNATTMTATTPAYVSGSLTVNVSVNNTVSTVTLTNGYTYIAVAPNITSCSYPGGILTTAWVCVGTNMNVFPNTFLNIKGGLLCTAGVSISGLVATLESALNIGGNSLLPGLYTGCTIQLCNNSTCTGLVSNLGVFS